VDDRCALVLDVVEARVLRDSPCLGRHEPELEPDGLRPDLDGLARVVGARI
jgi:hypothetical protein